MIAPTVLSFDLDDTLWPVGPVLATAESAMLSWLQAHYPRAVKGHSVESLQAMRMRVAGRYPERCHDMTFVRHHALKEMFGASGHPESLADAAFEVFYAARNRVTLYDDVRPSLLPLRARYRLFALSNGNADLKRCGMTDLFDGHITAITAGAAKPDARIFARLLHEAGVEAGQVLHIGDDPVADVIGAARAGMQAAWLNRDARPWPAQLPAPPRTISTLTEIF